MTGFTTLISATELAQHSSDRHLVAIDCRHDLANPKYGSEAYAAGHIPGARFAAMETELSDHSPAADGSFRGRHPLPTRAAFAAQLQTWGINNDSQVVAYDAHGGMFAARLWWMLRWMGHVRVAVLDGGIAAWTAAGQALSTEPATPTRGHFQERPSVVHTINVDEVLRNIETKERQVVDARAADRFRGENETMDPVGGHIPGARNRFFKDNLQADGKFKTREQLKTEWSAIIPEASKAIMQCGSGVTACHNLLALEIAGMQGATLYPGSWSEWCANPARPVATGS